MVGNDGFTDGRTMFLANGSINSVDSDGNFLLSSTVDAEPGQSGSGLWTVLEGDSDPRVAGVLSRVESNNEVIAAPVTIDIYNFIVSEMGEVDGTKNGNDLPENAIVGTDFSPQNGNGNDTIVGSYRRERILGEGDNDKLYGESANDRLEGGFGNDTLDGGENDDILQGDEGNDRLEGGNNNIFQGDRDIAVFSEDFENYEYSIAEGGIFGEDTITFNHNLGVISFSRNATLYANLTATQAISTIQGLTTASPLEGTKYNDALYKGLQFFSQSPLKGVTNVAYFTSDGSSENSDPTYHQDAINLRRVANVQAFGIYDSTAPNPVSQSQLDFVDSDNAIVLSNASQLETTLSQSGLISYLDRIEILVAGNVVETIQANQLTESPLGLTYEGTVNNLDVSLNAENLVTAKALTGGQPLESI